MINYVLGKSYVYSLSIIKLIFIFQQYEPKLDSL